MSSTTSVPVCHVIKGTTSSARRTNTVLPHARFTTPTTRYRRAGVVAARARPCLRRAARRRSWTCSSQTGERLTRTPTGCSPRRSTSARARVRCRASVLERSYASLGRMFNRRSMEFQVDHELGGADVLDGWREVAARRAAARHRVRAFPPRLIHIIAGNAPGVAAVSVMRGALTKGVHLLKLPSNDLFSATAILRAMAAVAPDHPMTRSFSAAYWRGGDAKVEGVLFRPQFFDKLVAWGGESTIRSAKQYIGPGLRTGGVRSQDIDLADRPRSLRIGRGAGRRRRARRHRRDDHEPAGVRIEPHAVRRGQRAAGRSLLRVAAARAWASSARPHRRAATRCPAICATRSTACATCSRTTASGAATTARAW